MKEQKKRKERRSKTRKERRREKQERKEGEKENMDGRKLCKRVKYGLPAVIESDGERIISGDKTRSDTSSKCGIVDRPLSLVSQEGLSKPADSSGQLSIRQFWNGEDAYLALPNTTKLLPDWNQR
ncbi:hypothetical protein EJ08DRAFT_492709 [Tothia fuscella]|uniref:Uncharacterized protein n=1 Tax=Tothia fuscella TaxID=1048955 RepID=A0A9P4NHX6_9PEZI|nr:hypothetical protein EJ08DRAFT_492709 [Tothia fuscella]